MFSRFLALALMVCATPLLAFEGKLHVETYKGQEITPYTKNIVQLSNKLFREYPYFYDGNAADYTKHLESYAKSKNGVVSIAMDGDKIVGIATGIPLTEAWTKYQEPFRKKGADISKTYYLGELLVLPEYTGKGLGQQMTKEVEKYATGKGYKLMATQVISEKSVNAPAPNGYYSITNVLKKLDYQERPDITQSSMWVNVNERKESPHEMIFWTKPL